MTIRIGYWDCPSCNAKKNLGPNPTCNGCGRPRGANVPFYTDDSAPVVEDPELVARARAGADWTCKYCGADNRAGKMDCQQCGAGPDGAVRRAEQFTPVAPVAAKKSSAALVLGILAGLVVLVGAAVWFFFVRTTALQVTVESAAWIKTAQIEERQTKKEEAWQDKVPDGARVVAKETKRRPKEVQDGTKKVKVGQKNLGNGMFEDVYEERPNMVTKDVDDTWVRYEVDTWAKKETLEKKTSDGSEPPDPAAGLATGGARRVGATTNNAVFALKGNDGKAYTFEVDASKEGAAAVKRYAVGKSYRAEVNAMGRVQSLGAP
ncbi:MAG: hypothetical protein KIT84_37465 [Labilithrix sp.]|nr:hypothetical protein [Labilithrix sp.]MCW5816749.1 hypothetical protein [Labilithrix sp.]